MYRGNTVDLLSVVVGNQSGGLGTRIGRILTIEVIECLVGRFKRGLQAARIDCKRRKGVVGYDLLFGDLKSIRGQVRLLCYSRIESIAAEGRVG